MTRQGDRLAMEKRHTIFGSTWSFEKIASVLTGSVALRRAPKVNASAAVNLRIHPASLAAHSREPKTTHEMIVPTTEKRRMGCSCLRKCLAFISKPAAKMMGGCDRCMKRSVRGV